MRSISTEAKVGLFVLAALIILGYMSFRVGQYGFGLKKGYTVNAVFDNVAGLSKDADVMIAGVEVGKVEGIGLKDGRALVTMRIVPGVRLEKDVVVTIKTHGILGDKYIEIVPGTRGEPYLEPGQEIDRVERQADLDKLLLELGKITNDVMAVTASLRKVVGGEEGENNLQKIIENTRDLSGNLNELVKKNDEKFTMMVESFTRASEGMEKTFTALSEITGRINKGEGTFGRLVNDESVFDHLDKTVASLNEITTKINEGKGSIGKLVNDEETVDTLNASLKSIDKSMESLDNFVSKAEQFRTYLSYRGEYLFDSGDGKG
ncbi:MAG TPA: MlaD family protein, partial [Syntrophales bacterium]|nr:MlaD family protein [Syntrophales bacterium]